MLLVLVVGSAAPAGAAASAPASLPPTSRPPQTATTFSQAPGDVTLPGGRPRQSGPSRQSPSWPDLITRTATDDGTTISFSAKTVALSDPTTDPNWRNNTYIGWAIDPR